MDHKKKAVGILAIGLAFIIVAVGMYVCGYFVGKEAGKAVIWRNYYGILG